METMLKKVENFEEKTQKCVNANAKFEHAA